MARATWGRLAVESVAAHAFLPLPRRLSTGYYLIDALGSIITVHAYIQHAAATP